MPKLATINECAKMANLAQYHVRQMVLQGKVKYIMAGKKYLVNLDSLYNYLDNGDVANNTVSTSNSIRRIEERKHYGK